MVELDADPRERLYQRAYAYISDHPELRVPDLARHLGMSESGLYAFFRSYAHATPIEIKNRIQVEKAISLLRSTDISVEEISERCGFSSVAYFRRIVLHHTDKTPTRIRKEARLL